jgi:mevalonate kinase
MIPDTFEAVWQAGLDSGAYYLKLNGSGGGGFLLGFTPDYDETRRLLAGLRLEMIPVSVSTFG